MEGRTPSKNLMGPPAFRAHARSENKTHQYQYGGRAPENPRTGLVHKLSGPKAHNIAYQTG